MNTTPKKVWQTDSSLHPKIEQYTVGSDYLLDQTLIPYDLRASAAHAHMLKEMGILTDKELKILLKGLREIETLWKKGEFSISQSQEDGHTAIEQYLTEHYGEVGKKLHTARSRNDQVLVMLRLYMKEVLTKAVDLTSKVRTVFKERTKKDNSPMPGFTHMQKAMPTTTNMWFSSYADAFADTLPLLKSTLRIIDQNPLGSASGFGIRNLKLKRSVTTNYLGFAKTQQNPMYCGMSRGYFEELTLSALSPAMLLAGKFASDMLLFSMDAFGFFSLSQQFTTGSSIMPQKRNYDVYEIMRGNGRVFEAKRREIRDIIASLGSGYHRDFQLTKKPFLEGVALFEETMDILALTIPRIKTHHERLAHAMTDDLFVTEQVYERVKRGESFRDAYRAVKKQWEQQRNAHKKAE